MSLVRPPWPLLGLLLLTLTACGQRGALYLPGTPDPADAPPTPTQEEEDERDGQAP